MTLPVGGFNKHHVGKITLAECELDANDRLFDVKFTLVIITGRVQSIVARD
jgi:hypothetical protein